MEKAKFYANHLIIKKLLIELIQKLVELEHQYEDVSDSEITNLTECLRESLGENLFDLLSEIQQIIPQKMSADDVGDWVIDCSIPDTSTRFQRAKEDAEYRNWLKFSQY